MYQKTNECMETLNKIRLVGQKYMMCEELPSAEFFVLVEIERLSEENEKESGVTNSQIAETMDTTISGASKMIKNLEQKGYVMRNASSKDRRVVYISTTEKGKEILKKTREKHKKIFKSILENMGEEDLKEFNRLVKKWYLAVKKGMEEAESD